jgi:hypothetical protein
MFGQTLLATLPLLLGASTAPPHIEYGDPVHYQNITLVPVHAEEAGPLVRYTLLERGLKDKTLAVRELAGSSAEAEVSEVEVKNSGKLAVFLLGGEMILGGKQDRIIQSDTVVPNDGKWQKVAVFCVEQGRWDGREMKFNGGSAVAHLKLQEAAMRGSQQEVWSEVARSNAQHGTTSDTQTYRRTIQNAKIRSRIAGYRSDLAKQLPSRPMSGVIFAINGEIQVADLFENSALFGDLSEKLLSAYILSALEQQIDPSAPKLEKGKAAKFLDDARDAPSVESKKSGRATNYKKDTADAYGSDTVDSATGKSVRSTYINKKKK